jgi:hypothetical protein
MKKIVFFFAAALIAVLAPKESAAVTKAGLFKLSLDTTFFRFGIGELDPDDGGARDFDTPTVGIGMQDTSIGFGFTVIPGLVIGGRVTFGLQGFDTYLWDDQVFIWSALPCVDSLCISRASQCSGPVLCLGAQAGRNSDD